ncbi:hypothetical protein RQP46_007178 [Phenoliferia psychrophenolica]
MSDPFEIHVTAARGLTLRLPASHKPLVAGTNVLSESPLIAIKYRTDLPSLDEIMAKVRQLDVESRRAFDALQRVPGMVQRRDYMGVRQPIREGTSQEEDRVLQIWAANSKAVSGSPYEPYHYWAVFPSLSRVNHSCTPNCVITFDSTTQKGTLRTVRDVAPEGEFAISYLPIHEPRSVRQRSLRTYWGFRCTCYSCSLPEAGPLSEASDQRRYRISNCEKIFHDWETLRASGAEVLAAFWEVVKPGGAWEEERLALEHVDALAALTRVVASHGNWNHTTYFCGRAIEALEIEKSSYDPRIEEFSKYAKHPPSHPSWKSRHTEMLSMSGIAGWEEPRDDGRNAELIGGDEPSDEVELVNVKKRKKNKKKKKKRKDGDPAEVDDGDAAAEPEPTLESPSPLSLDLTPVRPSSSASTQHYPSLPPSPTSPTSTDDELVPTPAANLFAPLAPPPPEPPTTPTDSIGGSEASFVDASDLSPTKRAPFVLERDVQSTLSDPFVPSGVVSWFKAPYPTADQPSVAPANPLGVWETIAASTQPQPEAPLLAPISLPTQFQQATTTDRAIAYQLHLKLERQHSENYPSLDPPPPPADPPAAPATASSVLSPTAPSFSAPHHASTASPPLAPFDLDSYPVADSLDFFAAVQQSGGGPSLSFPLPPIREAYEQRPPPPPEQASDQDKEQDNDPPLSHELAPNSVFNFPPGLRPPPLSVDPIATSVIGVLPAPKWRRRGQAASSQAPPSIDAPPSRTLAAKSTNLPRQHQSKPVVSKPPQLPPKPAAPSVASPVEFTVLPPPAPAPRLPPPNPPPHLRKVTPPLQNPRISKLQKSQPTPSKTALVHAKHQPHTTRSRSLSPGLLMPAALIEPEPFDPVQDALQKVTAKIDWLPFNDAAKVRATLDRVETYGPELPLSAPWTLSFSTPDTSGKQDRKSWSMARTDIFTATTVMELCGPLKALDRILSAQASRAPSSPAASSTSTDGTGPTQSKPRFGVITSSLKNGTNLSFFRDGIAPTWEDVHNRLGGRLLIMPKFGQFDVIFYDLIWLLAGASLDDVVDDEDGRAGTVAGIVASCRKLGGERIEVWTNGPSPSEEPGKAYISRLKDALARELRLPDVRSATFKKHN